ncbi:hypothetical protein [Singulisphaera sp. PoT]|uniref:hypothetical protein n=1 Tax=Singulisphaera sp. PoT TaxID=3411797 RepID=UPI003BF5640B
MRRRFAVVMYALAAWSLVEGPAEAGMPSPFATLEDLARLRLQSISFFLATFLVCAWLFQRIWNGLTGDFPRLPRLSFRRAIGVMTLWGLLFLIVLTMISGARELLTPGAWRKDGLTYKLDEAKTKPAPNPDPAKLSLRRQKLESLGLLLSHYAESHGGQFPPDAQVAEIPEKAWVVPDPSEMKYRYIQGQRQGGDERPLAIEPAIFDKHPLVLFTSLAVRPMTFEQIKNLLASGGK